MSRSSHKAGFVSIIGKPNVGKSTLMNALIGERLSVINPKAQTTRHRILGILGGDNYQIVFSDTPGFIKPNYKLQQAMVHSIHGALEDADLILFIEDINTDKRDEHLISKVKESNVPILVVLNKMDLMKEQEIESAKEAWKNLLNPEAVIPISALNSTNLDQLMAVILSYIPEHPAYYPKDALTDRTERFFISEIIRGKILSTYKQEVPYSTEVFIESFKEDDAIIRIRAIIFVNRKSQKPILIGKGGEKLKKVGIAARKDIETFLGKQVYIELFVKVKENWRDSEDWLKRLGY